MKDGKQRTSGQLRDTKPFGRSFIHLISNCVNPGGRILFSNDNRVPSRMENADNGIKGGGDKKGDNRS